MQVMQEDQPPRGKVPLATWGEIQPEKEGDGDDGEGGGGENGNSMGTVGVPAGESMEAVIMQLVKKRLGCAAAQGKCTQCQR